MTLRLENMTDNQLYRLICKVEKESWADEDKRRKFLSDLIKESNSRDLGNEVSW